MRGRDEGQISVLTIGFLILLGLLAVVVVNSSAAFLQRRELDNLADGAALAAADGLSREAFYRDGRVEVDPSEARRLVAGYLGGEGLTFVRVGATDGQVHVHLERVVELAIAPPGWDSQTTIVAEATSQLRVSE